MIAAVSVSVLFYLFSLSLVALTGSYCVIEIVVSVMLNYLKSEFLIIFMWICLEKGECFNLNHSLGCPPYLYNIIRLLGQIYHFSLLIC